jgi:glycosyltransferase involved in cell wall biosynthesis
MHNLLKFVGMKFKLANNFCCNASAIVEVITEVDNKQITTGAKRNNLLNKAQGKYICFIDDDDHISNDYLRLILEAIESDADCIATTVASIPSTVVIL